MLQTTTNINIDFYDKKYVLINAKQLDSQSRFLSITCYNHGEFYRLNEGEHSAYIRYRKADNNSVFNFCEIDRKGSIVVELTEQMLAVDGICVADLVIVNEGGAKVDTQTGEIVGIENTSILSTMPLHIDVTGTAVANSDIESSYEYDGLNDLLERAEAEYTEVILTSKSWAVGNTDTRDGENTDNAKYWSEQSKKSANASSASATNASTSEANAKDYMSNALTYSQEAQSHMNNSETYMNNAKTYMDNAEKHMNNAEEYMDNANDSRGKTEEYMNIAKSYMDNAESSKITAESYRDEAEEYMDNAATSALNASDSEVNAAVSASNAADSEANASTYYQKIQSIVNGLETGFIPMGTISFSELATVERTIGCVYNIRDDFTTNENFAEGSGMSYTAGTNVYVRSDGLFDCFGGSSPVTATVNEVKQYLNIN
jgi:hypothetical protein